mmetsp:Transcript_9027/g.12411  ORF Transcript_9027/g.12411 Transcript_9027/m.12411 type:complete len:256 (-) Transcript_9027:49-816(-)
MLSIVKNRRKSISSPQPPEEQEKLHPRTNENNTTPPQTRPRRHTISSDTNPHVTETKTKSPTPKLLGKLFRHKSDDTPDEYLNVSDESPVEVAPNGGVIFRVRRKLPTSGPNYKAEVVPRQLIIDSSTISEYEPRTQQLLHAYKFEDIIAFFYTDDNNFFGINWVNPNVPNSKPQNITWKYVNQVHRIKAVVKTQIKKIMENKNSNEQQSNNTSNSNNNTPTQTKSDLISDQSPKTPRAKPKMTRTSSNLIIFDY